MLIFLDTPIGRLGVEEGVVRAAEMELLESLEQLRRRAEEARAQLLQAAQAQADAVLAAAHEQAQEVGAQARREAQALHRQAREDGLQQAMQEWRERQVDGAIDKSRAMREMHARLAEVVTHAVERIVHSEDRGALYQRALKNVQSLTRGASTLRLRVGTEDHAVASACLGALDARAAGLEIELVADASLRPGSCIFESDTGVLDASLQTQLDGLRGAMERAVQRAAAEQTDTPGQEAP
jgi:type III secretion protein L